MLTHWGRVTHICVSKLNSIGSDNGLSPGRRQAIIWTNDGILLIRTFRTHFSEILSKMHTFSFKKMHFKMSSGKWRPSCLGLNELNYWGQVTYICIRKQGHRSSVVQIMACHLGLLPFLTWISNYIHYKVWDQITYPFINFNSANIEVKEWISNFIIKFIVNVITYPCWD